MTEKVDIYSMGMVFYSLISGRVPFSGERSSTNVEQPTIDPSWHGGYIKVRRVQAYVVLNTGILISEPLTKVRQDI